MIQSDTMDLLERYKAMSVEELRQITPFWRTHRKDIDLSKQNFEPLECLASSGFGLYLARVDELFSALTELNKEVFGRGALWNDDPEVIVHEEDKLALVLDHWRQGHALIPPTISDSGFGELIIPDGKHRLKVALFLQVETLPVIIFNASWPTISVYFKPERIS